MEGRIWCCTDLSSFGGVYGGARRGQASAGASNRPSGRLARLTDLQTDTVGTAFVTMMGRREGGQRYAQEQNEESEQQQGRKTSSKGGRSEKGESIKNLYIINK